jgi:hypothetical protein
MANRSVIIIMGPGGVGKGPTAKLFKVDHVWEPYRMRIKGPKDRDKTTYVSPTVYLQLQLIIQDLGDKCLKLGELSDAPHIEGIQDSSSILTAETKKIFDANRKCVLWYPKGNVLLYPVRNEQFQMLIPWGEGTVQVELYAPALTVMLERKDLRSEFGDFSILILNPTDRDLKTCPESAIMDRTNTNCTNRGDNDDDITKRVNSVPKELPEWKTLIEKGYAKDCRNWKFPEWRYIRPDLSRDTLKLSENELTRFEGTNPKPPFDPESKFLEEHQKEILKKARDYLKKFVSRIDILKNDEEIYRIRGLIVGLNNDESK